MKITWLGTGTVLLETGEQKIMFDPFIQLPGGEHPTDLSIFDEPQNVFITHSKATHLSSVPELIEKTNMLVHCGPEAAKTLIKMGLSMKQIRSIHLGDIISLGEDLWIRALKGRYVGFGPFMVLKTVVNPRIIRYSTNLFKLAKLHKKFNDDDVTLAYQVKAEGKTILVLGSMALDDRTEYPKEPDLLILPYQGSSSLQKKATNIIRKLRPKTVMLSHFDDAFPPLSKSINPKKFHLAMKKRFPEIELLVPKVGEVLEFQGEEDSEAGEEVAESKMTLADKVVHELLHGKKEEEHKVDSEEEEEKENQDEI